MSIKGTSERSLVAATSRMDFAPRLKEPKPRSNGDRRRNAAKVSVERRRSTRRCSDRLALSFTSAFVAQWLGQELAGGEPGGEMTLRRSADMVYKAAQTLATEWQSPTQRRTFDD